MKRSSDFVRSDFRVQQKEIAEVIVEKGKQHYSYSQSIEAAEKLLGRSPCRKRV